MLAVYARYRGSGSRRAQIVADSAHALETLPGVHPFEFVGVEDIVAVTDTPQDLLNVVMNLLSAGNWAIGIGVQPGLHTSDATAKKLAAPPPTAKTGTVTVRVVDNAEAEKNIAAAFLLVAFVLGKRSGEGREATDLVRSGLNQNEAAEALGISKQAMSQRLQAAGWQAEQAGWNLACALLEKAEQVEQS